jgi:hypothetical protein
MQKTVKAAWEDLQESSFTAPETERMPTCFRACDEPIKAAEDEQ